MSIVAPFNVIAGYFNVVVPSILTGKVTSSFIPRWSNLGLCQHKKCTKRTHTWIDIWFTIFGKWRRNIWTKYWSNVLCLMSCLGACVIMAEGDVMRNCARHWPLWPQFQSMSRVERTPGLKPCLLLYTKYPHTEIKIDIWHSYWIGNALTRT